MPLVEITARAGAFTDAAAGRLQREVAEAVLTGMGLPATDFFASATWVYLREIPEGQAVTGAGTAPGFLVTITALEKFLTPERNESLSTEITRLVRAAAQLEKEDQATVWVVVHEIPEGYWSVNGALTRRAKIDELLSQGG